jgi:hypothetical protein
MHHLVGFQVLMMVSMKMAVFWVVVPCRTISLMTEAASTSETSVNFYQTTRRYNPEDSHLQCTTSPAICYYFSIAINVDFRELLIPLKIILASRSERALMRKN